MLSPLAFELTVFLLGLALGSFLNVCISRLPRHEGLWKPPSHCPRCTHAIRWFDNIPVVSWLLLRARCRDCRAEIPWRYPLVELAYALWFAKFVGGFAFGIAVYHADATNPNSAWDVSNALPYFAAAVLGFLLLGLLVMDWQTHTLPDAFTLSGTAIGFFLVCTQAIFLAPGEAAIHLDAAHSLRLSSPGSFVERGNVFLTGPEHLIYGRLAAIAGAALVPFVIRALYRAIRKREGLGLGDVKLMAMIAAFLGFWPAVLAFFFGVILIFPYALYLLLRRKAHGATALPFGSFLCAGGLLAALFGEQTIRWYTSLF